jgi:hypothetical protein
MSALEILRALRRHDTCDPTDEKNERNETRYKDRGLISSNSFSSSERNSDTAGIPLAWVDGVALLCRMPPPRGFGSQRWYGVVDAAASFLERWASTAAANDWSSLDIFGVHAARPDVRFDAMGLVMLLDRAELVGIDRTGADLGREGGSRLRFYRRPLPAQTIPLWELGAWLR